MFRRPLGLACFLAVASFMGFSQAAEITIINPGGACGSGVAPSCGQVEVREVRPGVVVISSIGPSMAHHPAYLAYAADLIDQQSRFVIPLAKLDAEIRIAQKEIELLNHRLQVYEPTNRWIDGMSANFESTNIATMAVTAAQERIRILELERNLLLRRQSLDWHTRPR